MDYAVGEMIQKMKMDQITTDIETVRRVVGVDITSFYDELAIAVASTGATDFMPTFDLYSNVEKYLLYCSFRINGTRAYAMVEVGHSAMNPAGLCAVKERLIEVVSGLHTGVARRTH